MVSIRQATVHDLLHMQTTNLWCLPENYQVRKTNGPGEARCSKFVDLFLLISLELSRFSFSSQW